MDGEAVKEMGRKGEEDPVTVRFYSRDLRVSEVGVYELVWIYTIVPVPFPLVFWVFFYDFSLENFKVDKEQ
jgi:hypothetical protein